MKRAKRRTFVEPNLRFNLSTDKAITRALRSNPFFRNIADNIQVTIEGHTYAHQRETQ